MSISRRHALRLMGGAALATAAHSQTRPTDPRRARTGPILCLYSRLLAGVEYPELGGILNDLGFDGCDLSVENGGTVVPDQTPVDLVRAIETITGDGLELPLITTSFTNVLEPWARNVLAISAGSGVRAFRTGYSRQPAERIAARQNEIAQLAAYGRAAQMAMGLPYPAAEGVMASLDPNWVGYDFDPSQGRPVDPVLPRVRFITLRDARRDQGSVAPCPLGEGTVDWDAFFTALARARFSGPLTLQIDYRPQDRLAAIRRDLEFARTRLTAAYSKQLESGAPAPPQKI